MNSKIGITFSIEAIAAVIALVAFASGPLVPSAWGFLGFGCHRQLTTLDHPCLLCLGYDYICVIPINDILKIFAILVMITFSSALVFKIILHLHKDTVMASMIDP